MLAEILAELWPYLLLFYLAEGIKYLSTREVGFSSFFSRLNRFRFIPSGSFFFNLLPGGIFVRASQTPLIFTPKYLYIPTDDKVGLAELTAADFRAIEYGELDKLTPDNKRIRLRNDLYLKTNSAIEAAFWIRQIESIRDAAEKKRLSLIQQFRSSSLDLPAAQNEWEKSRGPFAFVTALSQMLFVLLFMLLPICLYTNLLPFVSINRLALIICLTLLFTLGAVGYTFSKTYGFSRGKLATEMLLMLISPLSTTQAAMHISRDLFYAYDWLVVTALLCPPSRFHLELRKRLRLINTLKEGGNEAGWNHYWDEEAQRIHKLARLSGVTIQEIYQAPAQQDSSSTHYCPVCHDEYRSGHNACHDCLATLQPFETVLN